jgi:seryl-tRNA synthetase
MIDVNVLREDPVRSQLILHLSICSISPFGAAIPRVAFLLSLPQDLVRESQRRRDPNNSRGLQKLVDDAISKDSAWRQARSHLDAANQESNRLSRAVASAKKSGEDASDYQVQAKAQEEHVRSLQHDHASRERELHDALSKIGNLVHDSVPVSADEDDNEVVHRWNGNANDPHLPPSASSQQSQKHRGLYNHVDLVRLLDIVELDKGGEVAGSRGYFLRGYGTLLNHALVTFTMHFLAKHGFEPYQTPYFLTKECMSECAQLEDFDEQLYRVSGEGDDKYLVATSEQSLCSMLRRTRLQPNDVPKRMCGYSSCFRKEVGSHGKDTLGIFRVHQFEKVEQFVASSPENDQSWHILTELVQNAEQIYMSLAIPYRVVNIVSGELNDSAAKKLDLEGWFPAGKSYRELVSASNCTDFQARRLGTRFGEPRRGFENKPRYAHLLNATAIATTRAICAILENHQDLDNQGVHIPTELVPAMGGVNFLPFVKALDKKGRVVERDTCHTFRLPGTRVPSEPNLELYVPSENDSYASDPQAKALRWLVSMLGAGPNMRRVPKPSNASLCHKAVVFDRTEGRVVASSALPVMRMIAKRAARLYPERPAEVARTEHWMQKLGRNDGFPSDEGVREVIHAVEDVQFLGGKLASIADILAASHLHCCSSEHVGASNAATKWLDKLNTLKPS